MKLEFKNVTKQYGEVNAVNKVNCVMEKGIYGLLGVNGAGKTTLMRMLCTIVQPSEGQILWNGKDYIDISDVEAITTEQTENKIFDMIDAVALHQQKKALDLYYDLLALKEAPMRILFLLSSQFQRLMIVKSMTNQGFGNKEIALKAGCPEWAVRKYQSQSRAFSMDQLKQAIRDGVEYETAVKTGHMNDQMAVELFLVQYSAGK